jgi:2-keto-4-pentenoate hydratase/2-oxohepta-3-ene-1,7-dioic acid hydratase in catechol pathway
MRRPWFEIWFAVVVDDNRKQALWVRQTYFVPKTGDGRATIWGAWFDAGAAPKTRSAKRIVPTTELALGSGDLLIRIADARFTQHGATGAVDGIAWDAHWQGGTKDRAELPAWLPAPTHARTLVHDATAEATVTLGDATHVIRGRAVAMHLWGTRRLPTLQWIWAPHLGDGSLELTAASLRDRFALGVSSLALDGPTPRTGSPATRAHSNGLVTATNAGLRELVHVRAWAEPDELVGYAYRDADDRDLMVAQSDIGSAHMEAFERSFPGLPWKPVDDRRSAGGVAVEIHQHAALPGVSYLPWDGERKPLRPVVVARRPDELDWPEVRAIVALGLTYAGHVAETGNTIDRDAPPTCFAKQLHAFAAEPALVRVPVPTSTELARALDAVEPGLAGELAKRFAVIPAVMDYEGELALVALGDVDLDALGRGEPQPFGLAACNDLTARLCQVLGGDDLAFWSCAKSFARFLPCAPYVWAPPGGIATIPELTIATLVNGEERQRASTRELIYDLPAIARAAQLQLGRPLGRGDVIATGTPAGIGMRLSPVQRRLSKLVTDRFRRAELLVSSYATSDALLRPGDVIDVDLGPAGRVRTRLCV